MSRVGFASGYDPKMTVRDIVDWMQKAEAAGFEVGFFSETSEVMRDAMSALSAIAISTSRLLLGSAQLMHVRSPLILAQTLATLDELSAGRLFLAPGACTPSVAARHSLPAFDGALGLVESIEAIRLLLSSDEPVSYHGEIVKFDDVRLGWKPIRRSIPMFIAATSKKGLRIAGRIGDGVVLNAITSPEYSANAIAIIREAAEEAGRDWDTFQVAQIINCSIEDDHRTALNAVRWEVASKLDPIQLPRIKPKLAVGEPYMHAEDFPRFEEAWQKGGKEALIAAVPDSYVEGMTASGTPDEVIARVEQYRSAGVELPLLRPAAIHQADRLLSLFAPSRVVQAQRAGSVAAPS